MTDPKPGDLIRATQHYIYDKGEDSTILEVEGVVAYLHNDLIVLRGGAQAWSKDRHLSSGYVQVTLEILRARPVANGSVALARCHPDCGQNPLVRVKDQWVWASSGVPTVFDPDDLKAEIVYDAGATS